MRDICLLFISAFVFGFGCVHDRNPIIPKNKYRIEPSCPDNADYPPGRHFRATTFNAGAAPGVIRLVKQRTPAIAEYVAKEMAESDFMCLQEIWNDDVRQHILDAVNLPSENVYWYDTRGFGESGKNTCRSRQISGLVECVRERCGGGNSIDTDICARKKCFLHLAWLYITDRDCLQCLMASVGKTVEETRKICVNGPGSSRAYGGENGVMILSRHPMRNMESVYLPASGTNRVALMATLTTESGTEIEAACVHFSSSFGEMKPLSKMFDSWEEEQATQLGIVSRRLESRSEGFKPQLLTGDMNFGREHGSVKSEMIPTWNQAVRYGFDSPATWLDPPICSYCPENLLNSIGTPRLIDHVMLRQTEEILQPICAERILDRPIVVLGYDGQPVTTSLSDHFGTAVEFLAP